MGANFTGLDYFIWNEIPTSSATSSVASSFTGLTLYSTHMTTAPKRSLKIAA